MVVNDSYKGADGLRTELNQPLSFLVMGLGLGRTMKRNLRGVGVGLKAGVGLRL